MSDETLGELEELVMLAVARLDDEAYGATVRGELAERAGRSVVIATVYVTLMRLEDKGLVRSRMSDPEPVPGGKARRLFRLTRKGARALWETRRVHERMWEGIPAQPDLGLF